MSRRVCGRYTFSNYRLLRNVESSQREGACVCPRNRQLLHTLLCRCHVLVPDLKGYIALELNALCPDKPIYTQNDSLGICVPSVLSKHGMHGIANDGKSLSHA